MELRTRHATVVLLWLTTSFAAYGQQQFEDRRRFFDENQVTTDDPRRIPMPNVPRGPEGTTVLRGGRLFDGTGTAAPAATLVLAELGPVAGGDAVADRPTASPVFPEVGERAYPGHRRRPHRARGRIVERERGPPVDACPCLMVVACVGRPSRWCPRCWHLVVVAAAAARALTLPIRGLRGAIFIHAPYRALFLRACP